MVEIIDFPPLASEEWDGVLFVYIVGAIAFL